MLREILEETILKKRPERIEVKTFGNYASWFEQEGLYNDSKKCYEVFNAKCDKFNVKSAKAFIAFIKEEFKRRENDKGAFATAHITLDGGKFIADCNYNKGICEYSRLNSEGYNILNEIKDSEVGHEEFLHILRKLKPYIYDFNELYKTCSKIKVLKRSKVTSQPTFNEGGEKDSSFTCVYQLENGEEDEFNLPANFTVTVPFVKAGDIEYAYDIDLLYSLDNYGGILVKIQIPEWETLQEQAVLDEANFVKTELESYSDLLVLADF